MNPKSAGCGRSARRTTAKSPRSRPATEKSTARSWNWRTPTSSVWCGKAALRRNNSPGFFSPCGRGSYPRRRLNGTKRRKNSMRKFNTRLFAGLLAVFCCMTALSATAYADGGYYEQSETEAKRLRPPLTASPSPRKASECRSSRAARR